MARSSAWQPVWQLALVVFLTFSPAVQALYFYMDGQSPKCFSEELPKDTLVVGMEFCTATPFEEKRPLTGLERSLHRGGVQRASAVLRPE